MIYSGLQMSTSSNSPQWSEASLRLTLIILCGLRSESGSHYHSFAAHYFTSHWEPMTLMEFQSNFEFDKDSLVYTSSYITQITKKFCTYQDSTAVLVCAKFHCDQISFLWIIAMPIYIKFGLPSMLVRWAPGLVNGYQSCCDGTERVSG